jgi:hypothetical protein
MPVFSAERVAVMTATLDRLVETHRPTQNAHFVAVFEAGDEALTMEVAGRSGQVRTGRHAEADFGLSGAAEDWERYFSERPVSHGSLVTMLAATEVSSGVYPSVLAPSGNIEQLFANLPIYNTVIESAITGGRR